MDKTSTTSTPPPPPSTTTGTGTGMGLKFPSTSTMFTAYASVSATLTLLQQAYHQFIPTPLQRGIATLLSRLLCSRPTSDFILLVEENDGMKRNPLFEALEAYLCHKVLTTSASCLRATCTTESISSASATSGDRVPLTLTLARRETFKEEFEGVEVSWKFTRSKAPRRRRSFYVFDDNDDDDDDDDDDEIVYSADRVRVFQLFFLEDHKELVFRSYIPQVLQVADKIMNKERVLKLHTLSYFGSGQWESVKLNHPSTFDSLALHPDLKNSIIDDLNLFLQRKEFYRRVGRAWKRGYLLYGPPGTGKSSLIAAIANYLKFDVYDLQLMHIQGDATLRQLLLSTKNRSILVIEDIDCNMGLPTNRNDQEKDEDDESSGNKETKSKPSSAKISLSGLLNFIDGLWSSCGDERIIIFTTNHKERIDPALLRPGRMDVHVHMSYLGMAAFKILASNYLQIPIDGEPTHALYEEIEGLIDTINVTPAEVAEELIKSKDVDVALEGVIRLLKRKRIEMECEGIDREKIS